jgi:hypothetical protein
MGQGKVSLFLFLFSVLFHFCFQFPNLNFESFLGVSLLSKIYKFKSHYRNNIFYYIYFFITHFTHIILFPSSLFLNPWISFRS